MPLDAQAKAARHTGCRQRQQDIRHSRKVQHPDTVVRADVIALTPGGGLRVLRSARAKAELELSVPLLQ